ncbi:MAG: cysteine desulfurase [Spirochaetaceae bacterium]|nr:cysteine desulfurase [Spirochaetaceae bacterium]
MNRHYFDWAATALPDDQSTEAAWGNPSSLHQEGRRAKAALEEARSRCAAVLAVPPLQLYFTSGATESNAIILYATLLRPPSLTVLYSAIEHSSIRENCARLERLGRRVAPIGVEADGRVSTAALSRALDKNPDARFITIMAVNNEIGSFMDIPALVRCIRGYKKAPIHVHCDIVQAVGKVPVDIAGWDIDSASLSAHKIGGPRGIGLLYLKKPLEVLYAGGGQEGRIRAGTENVAGALALARCLERHARIPTVKAEYEKAAQRFTALISFLRSLPRCSLIPADRQISDPRFSPYILQTAFEGLPGEVLVRALDDAGCAVSTGSACSIGEQARPVLSALHLDEHTQLEGIRISQGWSTTAEDIHALCKAIEELLNFL